MTLNKVCNLCNLYVTDVPVLLLSQANDRFTALRSIPKTFGCATPVCFKADYFSFRLFFFPFFSILLSA